MVSSRQVRLERILGANLDDFGWDDVLRLIEGGVGEDQDLDFKREHYGTSDSSRRALASDVAALANTTGGLILVGVAENDLGVADRVTPVSLADEHLTRYRQTVASLVLPLADFTIRSVPDPAQPDQGAVLLIVQRSPLAPHAVQVNRDSLRFPRRHGTTTEYLREPEVAAAYRDRFALGRSRAELAVQREEAVLLTLDGTEPWTIVTLVPDLPGSSAVDRASFLAFQKRIVGKQAGLPWSGVTFTSARAGYRHLRADDTTYSEGGGYLPSRWAVMEHHSDGSGVYVIRVPDLARKMGGGDETRGAVIIDDESVAAALLAGLSLLGQHAWESGAGGMAQLRALVWPVDADHPASLGYARGGFSRDTYGPPVATVIAATATAPLEYLQPTGPDLVMTAYQLLSDVAQSFGQAEVGQLSPDGRVRIPYWSRGINQAVAAWCTNHGIDTTDDVLPQ